MKYFRITYRLSALVFLSISGLVLMGIYGRRKQDESITQKQKNIRQWWLRNVVSIIGLKLAVKGDTKHDQPALWVANHLSWLDIPVISSEGAAFLSKSEVQKWPVIGWLGEKAQLSHRKLTCVNIEINA